MCNTYSFSTATEVERNISALEKYKGSCFLLVKANKSLVYSRTFRLLFKIRAPCHLLNHNIIWGTEAPQYAFFPPSLSSCPLIQMFSSAICSRITLMFVRPLNGRPTFYSRMK